MKIFVTILGFLGATALYIHLWDGDPTNAIANFITLSLGYLYGKAQ